MQATQQLSPLLNWIPYKLMEEDGQLLCKWLYVADHVFSEPFFDETLMKCQSHQYNSNHFKCVSSVDDLHALSGSLPSLAPTAFIFHVSRCGSTLLSQLLGLDETVISLAEVPLFDELLRWPSAPGALPTQALEKALESAIQIYGQKRRGDEKHLFVKLDSWHLFFYETVRKLYPDVPFILLYRSPDEVLASHRRHRGMQAVPGLIEPELFGFEKQEINGLGLDVYTAKVLERYLLKILEIARHDPKALLLNYSEGAMAMLEKLLAHVNVTCSEPVTKNRIVRSRNHSKYPGQVFTETYLKEEVPEFLTVAMMQYEILESIREKPLPQNTSTRLL